MQRNRALFRSRLKFPNHHPDPSVPENLRDLIHALKTTDAEIGLAFDGDGDRVGVVTKDGSIIYPDRQLMCLLPMCCPEILVARSFSM